MRNKYILFLSEDKTVECGDEAGLFIPATNI
jgi:hypothetical protein